MRTGCAEPLTYTFIHTPMGTGAVQDAAAHPIGSKFWVKCLSQGHNDGLGGEWEPQSPNTKPKCPMI